MHAFINQGLIFAQPMENTLQQYGSVIAECRALFLKKMHDYGSAWRILRPSSLTDQIFIKAQRIRTLQEKGTRQVDEGIAGEFQGIVNYAIIALIQLQLKAGQDADLSLEESMRLYDQHAGEAQRLMQRKNHDYGEAWRDMRISSLTDLILMKLLRTKQIEDNKGKTLASEGVEANYQDMLNYAAFALIKLNENEQTHA